MALLCTYALLTACLGVLFDALKLDGAVPPGAADLPPPLLGVSGACTLVDAVEGDSVLRVLFRPLSRAVLVRSGLTTERVLAIADKVELKRDK